MAAALAVAIAGLAVVIFWGDCYVVLEPETGPLHSALLVVQALLVVAMANNPPRSSWWRQAGVLVVLAVSLPHFAFAAFGRITLTGGDELVGYVVHAAWLAAIVVLAVAWLGPDRSRRVAWILAPVALAALIGGQALTFSLARDRDAVTAACDALEPGASGPDDVRAQAARHGLDVPEHGVPEHGGAWVASELHGVMGWQCSVRLVGGVVAHRDVGALILD